MPLKCIFDAAKNIRSNSNVMNVHELGFFSLVKN